MKSIIPDCMLHGQRPYVLIIDDDDDDLQMLSSSLELQGVKTISFNSGEKAIYYLQLISDTSDLPVLVISDYNMPGMNGQQILVAIKTNTATKDIPVVMFTTSIPPVIKKNHLHPGAFNWYVKPFSYLDFTKQVGIFKALAYSFMPTN
jgi:CheY-like chemotaxis protein